MEERKGLVTFLGKPMTLVGPELTVGSKAPDATLVGNDMSPVQVSDFLGKVVVVSVVPSLDTPTCDMETRRFNQEAAKLPSDVVVLTVSRDLPFAQKRWCGAAGVDRVTTLSDFREAAFGRAWGVLIGELGLLARVVFVLDRDGVVRYVQVVGEIAAEPDYGTVLEAVRAVVAG